MKNILTKMIGAGLFIFATGCSVEHEMINTNILPEVKTLKQKKFWQQKVGELKVKDVLWGRQWMTRHAEPDSREATESYYQNEKNQKKIIYVGGRDVKGDGFQLNEINEVDIFDTENETLTIFLANRELDKKGNVTHEKWVALSYAFNSNAQGALRKLEFENSQQDAYTLPRHMGYGSESNPDLSAKWKYVRTNFDAGHPFLQVEHGRPSGYPLDIYGLYK